MERLPVFKALGDNTRYAIYLELARSARPLSTAEVAEALDLHPNTVRPHLERMREVGLLEVDAGSRGEIGRPQHRYTLAVDAPSLGLEPSAFRLLARLAAGVAASSPTTVEGAAATGRGYGHKLARQGRGLGSTRSAGGYPPAPCVAALTKFMDDMGFDPVIAADGAAATVAFTRCPFQEVAEAFPEVVCQLHRGIVEGVVEELGGAEVLHFGTLDDRAPCTVELIAG